MKSTESKNPAARYCFLSPEKRSTWKKRWTKSGRTWRKKWLRRWGPVQMNKFGLKRGGSIGMKLYTLEELKQLEAKSRFGEHNSIDKTALLNISIFVCIHLWKPGSVE